MSKQMKINNEIAVFGLGRMGAQTVRRLCGKGFRVLAWNRSEGPVLEIRRKKIWASTDLSEVVAKMAGKTRLFWIQLPHSVMDSFVIGDEGLGKYLKKGDVVVDAGNSFYKDTIRRSKILSKKGIHYFDCGTSGGVWGEKNGFALMIGGPAPLWPKIRPFAQALSSGLNFGYLGESGAGHFAKMVHNGIEYGMMEAIGEGYAVLEKSPFRYNLKEVTRIYKEGTVIRSWLIDLCYNIFKDEDVRGTVGKIDSTGEGEWTVNTAKELGVDARVIEDSLHVRKESFNKKDWSKFSNKIVALLRKQFGGHAIHPKGSSKAVNKFRSS